MKFLVLWSLVAPVLLSARRSLAQERPPLPDNVETSKIVPNRFIIEVETQANIPNKRSFARDLDAIYASIKARDVEFEVIEEFEAPDLFVGASVVLDSPDSAAAVEALPGVTAVHPVYYVPRPEPVSQHVLQGPNDPEVPQFNKAPHFVAGVDKVHAQGIYGNGIKVAIIDTGIDYRHPNLGGSFGPGNKVIGGYDFVGDSYGGWDPVVAPDDDPLDCYGHGTHVAGIVAASGSNAYNLTGVAPNVSILAYKVFGCFGGTSDDYMVAAMLRAVSDGADIITMSIGSERGWAASAAALVANRIAETGKVVTISAGNSGHIGSWYASDPATAPNVISVGSAENLAFPFRKAQVHGVEFDGPLYSSLVPLDMGTSDPIPLYAPYPQIDNPADACNNLPEDTPDISDKIIIVRAGGCGLDRKALAALWNGAKGILIYDDGTGDYLGSGIPDFIKGTIIPAADGEYLVTQLAAGTSIQISFPTEGPVTSIPSPYGALMSPFSSYGPSNEFYFKPAVTAPGGHIASTFLTTGGSFAVFSGTSMSAPFVAGAAALYLEAKGKTVANAKALRTAFETNAKTIVSSLQPGALPQTVTQAGAGLINIHGAIFSKTRVSPGELMLDDLDGIKNNYKVTITNTGNTPRTYNVTHVPAGTALTFRENGLITTRGPVPQTNQFATVTFSHRTINVGPGQTKTVDVRITPPSGIPRNRFPVYSGFVVISSGTESHKVTYLGLGAKLKDVPIFDDGLSTGYSDVKMPVLSGYWNLPSPTAPRNYTFENWDFPAVLYRLAFGTNRLRLDLVATNTQLPRRELSDDLDLETRQRQSSSDRDRGRGGRVSFPHRPRPGSSFAAVKTIGTLFEETGVPRTWDDDGYSPGKFYEMSEPKFANGTQIPRGQYKLLLRVLKSRGNPDKQEDYESWLSPVVGLYYP